MNMNYVIAKIISKFYIDKGMLDASAYCCYLAECIIQDLDEQGYRIEKIKRQLVTK